MMLALLALTLATSPVRPELVEGRPTLASGGRASTSSARTEKGSAIEAERAFAADAQAIGQWAAFRKWAAPDAILFWPQPVNAHDALRPLKEPAKAVQWSPARSFVSCDGTLAANTGPTRWPDGRTGYFSTIWAKRPEGWRWTLDHGDAPAASPGTVGGPASERRASCVGKPPPPPPDIAFRCAPQASGRGGSVDGTLRYVWYMGGCAGGRQLQVWLWTGSRWNEALSDHVVAR